MQIITNILAVILVICAFVGFILLMIGGNYALWGSALRKYRALPDGLIICAVGAIMMIGSKLLLRLF